jgi:hypothetical protein
MQTIAEYYSAIDPTEGVGNLEVLCMGYFPDSSVAKFEAWRYWPELFEEAYTVIQERAEVEFLGESTAAQIMDAAMKRFLTRNGSKNTGGRDGRWVGHDSKKNVPPVWVSVMNQLRECRKRPITPHVAGE